MGIRKRGSLRYPLLAPPSLKNLWLTGTQLINGMKMLYLNLRLILSAAPLVLLGTVPANPLMPMTEAHEIVPVVILMGRSLVVHRGLIMGILVQEVKACLIIMAPWLSSIRVRCRVLVLVLAADMAIAADMPLITMHLSATAPLATVAKTVQRVGP